MGDPCHSRARRRKYATPARLTVYKNCIRHGRNGPLQRSCLREEMTVTVKVTSLCLVSALIAVSGCNQKVGPVAAAAPEKPKIGIHPFGTGDPNFKPDYSTLPPDMQKVFTYIDAKLDDHAENIQKWIKQP